MKVFLGVLLLIIMPYSANAQLKDTLNPELNQDLLKAKKVKTAGILMTITGTSLFTIGLIRLVTSPTECEPQDGPQAPRCHVTEWHGGGLITVGLLTMGVGVPVWTFAKQKEKYGRIYLFQFTSASIKSIGLKITF